MNKLLLAFALLLSLVPFANCGKLKDTVGALPGINTAALAALTPDEDPEDVANPLKLASEWTKFKTKYNKVLSPAEDVIAKKNFQANVLAVLENNQKFLEGKVGFTQRVHQFSDWTLEKVAKNLLGLQVPDVSSVVRLSKAPEGAGSVARTSRVKRAICGANGTQEDHKAATIWPELDYRKHGYVSPVKYQGECGCCWTVATAGVLEGQLYGLTGKLVNVSMQNILDCAEGEGYSNHGCNGGWPMSAFDYVKAEGVQTQEDYPFKGVDTDKCAFDKKKALPIKVTGGQLLPSGDEEELKKALFNVGPLAICINVNSQSFMNYASGVFDDPACSQEVNHAVLLVGYGTDEKSGSDYWLVKNSWGTDWGEAGFVKMARNKQNQCGIASWGQYPEVA